KARVLSQQRDESLNVIGFKGGDVVHKELFVISLGRTSVVCTHRASCPGERGVHRGGRRLEQLGTLTCGPCQHIPKDEHDTLAWREHLSRRDEREPHRILKGYLLRRISVEIGIANGTNPPRLRQPSERARVVWHLARARKVHRQASELASCFHIQPCVRRDRLQPAAHRLPFC